MSAKLEQANRFPVETPRWRLTASGSMDDGEILRELVWLILHAVPAGVMG